MSSCIAGQAAVENYRKTAHGIYDCKYHIVWCTKYRYQVMKGQLAERCRDLIRQICTANEYNGPPTAIAKIWDARIIKPLQREVVDLLARSLHSSSWTLAIAIATRQGWKSDDIKRLNRPPSASVVGERLRRLEGEIRGYTHGGRHDLPHDIPPDLAGLLKELRKRNVGFMH